MAVIKKHLTTIVLFALLLVLAVWSLFVGVLDVELSGLLQGDREHLEVFLISRLPRLLAILCTGIGMSVAGLIMQQLCMNKFVSPTTGATISSAQFGILLALLFLPNSTLWGRAIFSFVFAVLGTWIFVWFIQVDHIQKSLNVRPILHVELIFQPLHRQLQAPGHVPIFLQQLPGVVAPGVVPH